MNKYLILAFALLLGACKTSNNTSPLSRFSSGDLKPIFEKTGVKGCFLLYDLKHNHLLTFNEARGDSAFLPASTFKILNSLIALETGVIADEKEAIPWDSVTRGFEQWNQDQNLASAIKYSVVWFYQELARRIGEDQMEHWVKRAEYGNQNIGGNIDTFWLDGDLRISPRQQIGFLQRLYLNQLPFSQRNMDIVKRILIVEQNEKYTIRAKTGWAMRPQKQIGWYVGYLERGDQVYLFVNNIDIREQSDNIWRKDITMKVLEKLNLLD